jgi:glutathione S-transferase
MHAGFAAMRQHLPMNIRRPVARRPLNPAAAADLGRILAIWRDARGRFGGDGPFLFGPISAADAFYAPIASRLRTYGVPTDAVADAYVSTVLDHPFMAEWTARAQAETWIVPADEVDMIDRRTGWTPS